MSTTQTVTAGDAAATDDLPVVVLAETRTTPERELVDRWVAEHHPGAPVCRTEDDLARTLASHPDADPLMAPVRVTWLPPTRAAGPRPRGYGAGPLN